MTGEPTTVPVRAEPAPPQVTRPRWAALPVVLAGLFIATLDFFIVNVALPAIQRDLHAGSAAVQFVVAGYGLAYAAGLITGGRLGDIHGRRRMFGLGVGLFTLASAACGLAPSPGVLVTARVAQGVAAALLSPQVLSLLGVLYTGAARARAFTAYGLTLGVAGVAGQLLGGLLIDADIAGAGWRACFLINVPVGAAVLVLVPRLLPESTAGGDRRLDLTGVALVTLGLLAVIAPLIEGRAQGWPAWTWGCLACIVPLTVVFIAQQRRRVARGVAPLIDLALFGKRVFTVGVTAVLVFQAGIASYFLTLALYLQDGRGLDPLASGCVFSVLGLGFFVASLYGRRAAGRLGRQALALGGVVMAAGLALVAFALARIGAGGWLGVARAGTVAARRGHGAGDGAAGHHGAVRCVPAARRYRVGGGHHRAAGRQRTRRGAHRYRLLRCRRSRT